MFVLCYRKHFDEGPINELEILQRLSDGLQLTIFPRRHQISIRFLIATYENHGRRLLPPDDRHAKIEDEAKFGTPQVVVGGELPQCVTP